MAEVTKTLELKLIDPNSHKRRKFRETTRVYREALQTAFEAECRTRSEANDVVVDFDLSGFAKNALKRYVPQLCGDTYEADELDGEHPVKFTNNGIHLDRKPENYHEWNVKIPHHEDYHLWVPVGVNPTHRPWLESLYDGEAEMGEGRFINRDNEWRLHLTATREIPERPSSGDRTPVGVDIGEASLATVCHRDECGTPTAPELFTEEGATVRRLRKRYFSGKHRLECRGSESIVETYGAPLWRRIDDILHSIASQVVERVATVVDPILVMEDLRGIRDELDWGAFMNRRLHGWATHQLQTRIRYKAEAAGLPVVMVDPTGTSSICHACGANGTRRQQATFRCANDECWVTEYQADINAAVNIADRYPAGESPPREKVAGDDSGGDGASLTGPQDTQEDAVTQQATPGTHAS